MSFVENLFTRYHHQTAWMVVLLFMITVVDIIPGRSTAYNQKDVRLSIDPVNMKQYKSTEPINSHLVMLNETNANR